MIEGADRLDELHLSQAHGGGWIAGRGLEELPERGCRGIHVAAFHGLLRLGEHRVLVRAGLAVLLPVRAGVSGRPAGHVQLRGRLHHLAEPLPHLRLAQRAQAARPAPAPPWCRR